MSEQSGYADPAVVAAIGAYVASVLDSVDHMACECVSLPGNFDAHGWFTGHTCES